MTLSKWIEDYCEENEIELPEDIPDEETALMFLNTVGNGGGGGSSLPSVTSADEGKVLAVNASGEWEAEYVIKIIPFADLETFTFNDIVTLIKNHIILAALFIDESELPSCVYEVPILQSAAYNGASCTVTFSNGAVAVCTNPSDLLVWD